MQKLAVILLFLFVGTFSMAQNQDRENEGLKVGLVLSGGGAKGMAHIGALKVIEKAGIEIDYIGGTSMGAIVGALYASGFSAIELDSIFKNTDFTDLIEDTLPRGAKTFYEKENSERYAITLPFKKFKVSVPQAYSRGQNVYNELVRLLYPVRDVKNFKNLPIPFLCIATDIESGEEVLLDKGYLPEAVMASGSLPSLFDPAIVDGRVLIDGGVVNNYPVEEVRAMGADVIIGVDVQHGLRDREALSSATEILLQINNYRTALDMERKYERTDIYIKPDMNEYSVIDFNLYKAIIESGENAAMQKYEELEQLARHSELKREKSIRKVQTQDSLTINRMVITDAENYSRGYVKGKLRFELDEPTTFGKLQQGIGNLSATGNFQTIRYKLSTKNNEEELTLKLIENQNKTFIRLGAHYDNLYKTAGIINLTQKNFLMRDDVTSFDFIIGDNIRYNFQYYLDKGSYWSFGISSRFNEFAKDINFDLIRGNFEIPFGGNINTIKLDVKDFTNQMYVQTVLREEFAYRMGIEYKYLKYSTKTLRQNDEGDFPGLTIEDDRTLFEKSNFYSAFGQLTLDTYDDRYFPSKGLFFDGDFHFYVLSSDFNDNFKEFSIAKARMGTAFPLFSNLSMNIETEGGFKLGTSNVTSFDFVLGGFGSDLINNFTPFLGYDFLSLPGNSFVKAYGRLDFEFVPKNHFMFSANYANVDDDLFRTGDWFTSPDFSGYGVGYGWESFLGPLQVHYTWSPEGNSSNLFFSLGYWF